ncbi:uncharacterized protein [Drosophila kikkawai]|uniref:Uncharacterized protein isoform X1 n=1 Tax=Drosophila kikkawai TaxID=30033 RepID=A0ABM3C8J6_DROKI|nr:uncharacterized protein LOC108074028 isoform X1 [Drosophila kikkawai]
MANGKFLVKTQWKMLIFSASKNPMKINNQDKEVVVLAGLQWGAGWLGVATWIHPCRVPSASACAFITFQLFRKLPGYLNMHMHTHEDPAKRTSARDNDSDPVTQHAKTQSISLPKKTDRQTEPLQSAFLSWSAPIFVNFNLSSNPHTHTHTYREIHPKLMLGKFQKLKCENSNIPMIQKKRNGKRNTQLEHHLQQ